MWIGVTNRNTVFIRGDYAYPWDPWKSVTSTCPGGYKIISGGYQLGPDLGSGNIYSPIYNFPIGDTWTVRVADGSRFAYSSWALCELK